MECNTKNQVFGGQGNSTLAEVSSCCPELWAPYSTWSEGSLGCNARTIWSRTGCARATDELEERNGIPTALRDRPVLIQLVAKAASERLGSLFSTRRTGVHSHSTTLRVSQGYLEGQLFRLHCIGTEFLTGEMGCVPDRLGEQNFICSCPPVDREQDPVQASA